MRPRRRTAGRGGGCRCMRRSRRRDHRDDRLEPLWGVGRIDQAREDPVGRRHIESRLAHASDTAHARVASLHVAAIAAQVGGQAAERAMLEDAHGAGRAAGHAGDLLGAEVAEHAEQDDLRLRPG